MAEAVAPLRIPHFRALWAASIVSNVGSFFQTVAASWLMLELTHSAVWVGLMAASSTLPLLFLALVSGAVADLVSRTRLVVAAQTAMGAAAAAMAALTALHHITPGWLLALGLVLGVGVAFNLPAWQALVPALVPRGMLASAVALNSAAFNAARAVGPALGGLLVATAGPATAFALNAVSFAGVIVVVATLGRTLGMPAVETTSVSSAVALGIRFARYTRSFRRILLLLALFALTSASVQTVLPNRTEQLGGTAGQYGLLLGAMGAGALLGALARGPITTRLGRNTVPVTIVAFGAAGMALGSLSSMAWAAVAMVLAGAAWVLTLTTLNTTAQLMSPEWVRGRAMSLYSLSFSGIFPLGAIFAGALADAVGPGSAIASLCVVAAILGVSSRFFGIPGLHEVRAPEFTEARPAPRHADTAAGGPVMVVNTWVIDEAEFDAFLALMNEIRLVRLSTGAYRWRLYRNASDPHRLSEVFLTTTWEEHIRQHGRIDDASATLLRRATEFDRGGGPVSHHLVGIDVTDPSARPGLRDLAAAHRGMHEDDGSIPIGP